MRRSLSLLCPSAGKTLTHWPWCLLVLPNIGIPTQASAAGRAMVEFESFFFMGDEGKSAELDSFFDFGSSASSLTRLQKDCLRMLD